LYFQNTFLEYFILLFSKYFLKVFCTSLSTHHNTVGALNGSRDDATYAALLLRQLTWISSLCCTVPSLPWLGIGLSCYALHLARSACMGRYSTVGAIAPVSVDGGVLEVVNRQRQHRGDLPRRDGDLPIFLYVARRIPDSTSNVGHFHHHDSAVTSDMYVQRKTRLFDVPMILSAASHFPFQIPVARIHSSVSPCTLTSL